MKKAMVLAAAIFVFCFLFTGLAFAQPEMKWKEKTQGEEVRHGRLYNPGTAETISGEVIRVDIIKSPQGIMFLGVHLLVKTKSETIPVHLGPHWYIKRQDVKIEPQDKVEIFGSRTIFDGKPVIIAAEVKKDSKVLILRDENGFPAWSGWRRR